MTDALVLIGCFDPATGDAARRNIAFAETLAKETLVHCVGDDLDLLPEPLDGGPRFQHWRRYLADADLATLPRLHLADASAASGLLFTAMRTRPGGLVLFTDTLFDAFVEDFRVRGEWPHGFANWLVENHGPEGEILAEALVLRRRFTDSLACAIPALKPAIRLASHVFAASTRIAGVADEQIPILHAPALQPLRETRADNGQILTIACNERHASIEAAATAIRRLGREVRLLLPADHSWPTAADVAVHLGHDPAPAWSPFLRSLAEAGVPLIHANPDLPADAGIRIDHPEAHHQLVAAIGALMADSPLARASACRLYRYLQGLTAADSLFDRLAPALTLRESTSPVIEEISEAAALTLPRATPAGRTLLVGAAPGPAVIAHIWPDGDAPASPRFATSTLADRLAAATGLPAASLLARLGFEAPLIGRDEDIALQANALRAIQTIADAAAPWAAPAPVCLQPSITAGDAANWHISEAGGALWTLEDRGRALRCLLLVGGGGALYLENRGPENLRIASTEKTFDLLPNATECVQADQHGILDIRLRLTASPESSLTAEARLAAWLPTPDLWMTR